MNPLLSDLALILVVAGIVTIIFKKLKQPVVLGYIVAGILTGPYITFIPTINNIESVEFWGNIGVIFLLFGLGLEFNLKKITKVGGAGFMTVFTEVIVMFSVGILVGKILGWDWVSAIFLGGMLSISSTSIIIKAFDDLGIKNNKFTQLVFGALVVEDLVAILILVILPAIVVSKTFDGIELALKIGNLALFLLLWFTIGIFSIPTLFKKFKHYLSDETLVVVSLGLCLMMVVISKNAEISEALGAFVMGSILSGTHQSERIIKLTKPIKDFFGAIFFVSVGMLANPVIIWEYLPQILLISLAIIIAKPLAATMGLLFSGQTLKIAMLSGICLCQIGEFSFIIAQMGMDKNVIADYIYPVIISVSIITTFITPYWVKLGEPLYNAIYNNVKPQWQVVIASLGVGKKSLEEEGDWSRLLKSYATRVFIYGSWLLFVNLFFTQFIYPKITDFFGNQLYIRIGSFILNLIVMAPFLWALLRRKDSDGIFDKIWDDRKFARGPLMFMMILKYLIAFIAISITSSRYISMGLSAGIMLCSFVIVIVSLSRKIKSYYSIIENQFLTNLRSEGGKRNITMPKDMSQQLHIEKIEVDPTSSIVGKTISQIHKSKSTEALTIQIIRGTEIIDLPKNTEIIFPMDHLIIIGNDNQVRNFREAVEEKRLQDSSHYSPEMELFHLPLTKNSPLCGENGNISHIREKFGVLLFGIQRNNSNALIRTTSAVTLKEGDIAWIVGEKSIVETLKNQI